jgi:hypothetical protein
MKKIENHTSTDKHVGGVELDDDEFEELIGLLVTSEIAGLDLDHVRATGIAGPIIRNPGTESLFCFAGTEASITLLCLCSRRGLDAMIVFLECLINVQTHGDRDNGGLRNRANGESTEASGQGGPSP